jgi:DNA-binding transcriptional ArsR family regulator
MVELGKQINDLDKVVHEPARLGILTVLSACEQADFVFLKRVTELSDGNLSAHLNKLESAGLVCIQKRFVGKKPQTLVWLTKSGHAQIKEHWRRLESLRVGARQVIVERSS